jgi:predicted nucleic acid-binding protein
LKGNNTLAELLQGKTIYVSFITELELIGFKQITPVQEKQIHNLLDECVIVQLNDTIKKNYILLRRTYNLKLADALIAATAIASKTAFNYFGQAV